MVADLWSSLSGTAAGSGGSLLLRLSRVESFFQFDTTTLPWVNVLGPRSTVWKKTSEETYLCLGRVPSASGSVSSGE